MVGRCRSQRTKKCTRVADRAFPDGKSQVRNRVILVDYEVLGLQVVFATIF